MFAHADTITDRIDVSASGNGQTIKLSYLLTFDPNQNYETPSTQGLTLLSAYTDDAEFAPAIQSTPSWVYQHAPNGVMFIGPVEAGFSNLGDIRGGYGYLLMLDPMETPEVVFTELSESSLTEAVRLTTGSISVTRMDAPIAATPEPSSFALLGTGLLGVAGVLRRRFA